MFSDRFLDELLKHLQNSPKREADELAYAERLHAGLGLVERVITDKDAARRLDYRSIDEEELDWIIQEIYQVPDADNGVDGPITEEVLLRDMVMRTVFGGRTVGFYTIVGLPAQREAENYF